MANEPRNLYNLKDFFRLYINGVWKYIDEPVGWDKVNISMTRDKDVHGLNYEFADDKVELTFVEEEGGSDLRDVYNASGSDAVVIFQYGYYQNNSLQVQFSGNINFNDYIERGDGIDCTIQKTYFQSLFRTRYDTKVALNATQNLDGNPIDPLVPTKIKLHSKKLKKLGVAKQQGDSASTYNWQEGFCNVYIQPDTQNVTTQEVDTLEEMPLGISNVKAQTEERFQFQAAEAGLAKVSWDCSYRFLIGFRAPGWNIGDWSLIPTLQVYRGGSLVQTYAPLSAQKSGHVNNPNLDTTHSFSLSTYLNLQVNDEVYLNINVNTESYDGHRNYLIYDHISTITVEQETVAASSDCYIYKLFDVLNYVVEAITGVKNAVKSNFHGAGGCAELIGITNGFQIRNFDIDTNPVNISMKDLVEGMQPIWNTALQYSNDGTQDLLLVEPMKSFFKDGRILTIDGKNIDFNSWEETHSKDFVFNQVEIGYQNFQQDDLNTLDEFNTYHQYLTPINTYKQTYTQKSSFIASGYSIETQRREQFKTDPSTSLSNDEKIFVICYITQRKHYNISFNFNGTTVSFDKPVNMQAGDTFKVTKNGGGGANDATTFTVSQKDISAPEKYLLTAGAVSSTGVGTLEIFITEPEAEKNEPFSVVLNLLSPETAYNLRISPKRNLFNHSELLNSCLEKKDDAAILKNTFFQCNGDLVTKFDDTISCRLTDQNLELEEKDDVVLSDYNSRRQLFTPQLITFKANLTYTDLVYIKDRMLGKTGTDEDFGVIAHDNIHGTKYESYIWELQYDPVGEICQFTVRKKREIV